METSIVLKIIAALFLVALNAFFVAAEFALVAARRTRIQELVAAGDALARQVEYAQSNLDRSISGTQLGITLASLGLGWIGEPAVADTLRGAFEGLSAPWNTIATHGTATGIAFFLITFLHIVLGELAPKTIALLRPEAVSRTVAIPLNAFNLVTRPFIWFLNGSATLVLRVFGVRVMGTAERVHSPEEIEMLVRQSLVHGVVEDDEEAMIQGVFELNRTVAREVMTPRTDIVAFPETASLDEVLEGAASSGFSRFPVYAESIDHVTGIVLVKDLLPWLRRPDREERFSLTSTMREANFVPDTKPVDDLLAELRRSKVHMAVVVDEFGGTDGLVTLEDLLEEIVGDIFDEHDVPEEEIDVRPDGRIVIDGGTDLEDLIEQFGLVGAQDVDTYDTVAGYAIGRLGRIPDPGERVQIGQAELEILETQDQRVTELELHGARPAPRPSTTDGQDTENGP